MTAPNPALVRAAQDELSSIYAAPRALPPLRSLEEEAAQMLAEAQAALDAMGAERRAAVTYLSSRPRNAAS